MNAIRKMLTPDHQQYDGIRPISIYAMRAVFLLMATLMAMDVWRHIFTYDEVWEPGDAMNWSVWAAFSLLALIGVFRTVEMIPVLLLEIAYKVIWLVLVAVPLYQAGTLSDETTDGMLFPFALVVLPIAAVPWGYVIKRYKPFRHSAGNKA